MQKLIKKPLLKRSKELYKPHPPLGEIVEAGSNPTSAGATPQIGVIDEENAQAAEIQQHIRNLRPTLELVENRNEGSGSGERSGNDDSRFSTTFGFSHGVDVQGGVQVARKAIHKQGQNDKTIPKRSE